MNRNRKLCSFSFSQYLLNFIHVKKVQMGLCNLLSTFPEINDDMYNRIKSYWGHYNSMHDTRLDLRRKSYENQADNLRIYIRLKQRLDKNFQITNKKPNHKKANTMLMQLLLIIYVNLDEKTMQLTQDLFIAILKFFEDDCGQFDEDDEHFIQAFYNLIYHNSIVISRVSQYVFHSYLFSYFLYSLYLFSIYCSHSC